MGQWLIMILANKMSSQRTLPKLWGIEIWPSSQLLGQGPSKRGVSCYVALFKYITCPQDNE